MIKTSDRSWTLPPVLPAAFCSSTRTAVSPARCTRRPAGSPEPAIRERSPVDQVLGVVLISAGGIGGQGQQQHRLAVGRPADVPYLPDGGVSGDVALQGGQCGGVGRVSGPLAVAAMIGTGSIDVLPNGADRSIACWLGALAGRNFALSLCVTLDKAGNWVAAATAPMTQASRTSQRRRTDH
jgi:hypothetical protein